MDELILAQLLSEHISDNRKLQISEDLDITYIISDKSSAFQEKNAFLGYNCLHIAAIKSDLDLTQKLVNLGANVLQQGINDYKTPLRKAIEGVNEYSVSAFCKQTGVLEEDGLTSVLLSAQINGGNPLNAKCKNGISHLHIACMYNHAKAVWFFAKANECLDQAINVDSTILPGYTPLHCAIRYSSSETAEILLTLEADIYLENAVGISSVCYLIERLLDVNSYTKKLSGSNSYCNNQEMDRLNSILKAIVLRNRKDDLELIEKTGVSAFHLACALKDMWIMQSYNIGSNFKDINKPVTCKSKLWSGWTPLHFAVCCNIQAYGILLKNEADIRIRNANGETAFDLCLQRYRLEIPLSYLRIDPVLTNENTHSSDLMFFIGKPDVCQMFLKSLKDINLSIPLQSPAWAGYNLLHISVLLTHRVRLSQKFHQQVDYCIKTSHLVSVPWHEENQDIPSSWQRFESVLRKGCSVYTRGANGLTPIHLAFQLDEWHALEELLACALKDVVGQGGLSLLHIACAFGKIDVVERLLKNGADVNSRVTTSFVRYAKPQYWSLMDYQNKDRRVLIRANSTPLHIAVLFKANALIQKLLENRANVHAQDELGLTPLHCSMITSNEYAAQLLLREGSFNLRDVTTKDGLSYLHVAVFADDASTADKLLRKGADVNAFVRDTAPAEYLAEFVGKTPLHLAVRHETAARVLLENGANILAENLYSKYETPLDLAVKYLYSSVIFEKLKWKTKLGPLTASGLTTLHVACSIVDLKWARKLLKAGANPNARTTDGEGRAKTPMHLVITYINSSQLINGELKSFIELLVEHGADVNVSDNCQTSLHLIADVYFRKFSDGSESDKAVMLSIGNWLLSNLSSYAFNPTNADGFSYFHFACVTNNFTVIKKYLDIGVDINHSMSPFAQRHGGYTGLHFAIRHKNMDIIQLLLKRGAAVRVEDSEGNTPLHLAVQHFMNFQLFDELFRKGADINATNVGGQTPILCLLSHGNVTYEQFRFFVDRGSLIDITTTIDAQGIIGFTMEHAKPSDVESVIGTFIQIANVENAIDAGFLAIHSIASVQSNHKLTRDHYLNVIQRFAAKGSDIDEQNEEGKRALDAAISYSNNSARQALLLLGANVNLVEDENGSCSMLQTIHCFSLKIPLFCMEDHLWKMALLKLDLNNSIQKAMKRRGWTPGDAKSCRAELKKIECTKIYKSLTAKHFLSEWGAVIEYPNMSVVKRDAVDNFFKKDDDLRKKFPQFAGLLAMQYRKALARVKMMQPVKEILVAAGIELPDLCLETILKYLKNSELNFLIENADEVSQPRKRQRIQ